MNNKQLPRRILQYAAGLVCMAVGLVLLKRMSYGTVSSFGVSPITALPDAVANITPLTLGNASILLHALCVIAQIIVQKKVTLKSILCMCVGIPFGKLVDWFMLFWNPASFTIPQLIISLVLGIAVQGFGVALINGCDMMLPAPDELNAVICRVHGKKLSNVKMCADAAYVLLALVINLLTWLFNRECFSLSIGINSVASVLLTGRFIGLTFRLLPGVRMTPFFNINECRD